MPIALLALAIGGFGIGLTEFVIAGLLPQVATDYGVTEDTAGWLIAGYALSVAVGAIVVTAVVARCNRKVVLLSLMVPFIVGNLISALAPTFEVAVIGRIVAAMAHGAFFGVGAVLAASLVPPAKQAAAIAIMMSGLTAANVLGVPLGTLLGQQLGWRSTFWALVGVGLLAAAAIATFVPYRKAAPAPIASGLRSQLGAFRSGQVWATLVMTVLGFGGMFGAFTYIAYTLTDVAHFSDAMVPWLLIVFGVGLFAGNYVGGRTADRNMSATLIGGLAILAAVLAVFALTASIKPLVIVSLVAMGFCGFAIVPALMSRILRYAGDSAALASGASVAAFNIGNAVGAWLGGLTIAAGLGYVWTMWVGVFMTLAALAVAVLAVAVDRGSSRREPTESYGDPTPQRAPLPLEV